MVKKALVWVCKGISKNGQIDIIERTLEPPMEPNQLLIATMTQSSDHIDFRRPVNSIGFKELIIMDSETLAAENPSLQ